MNDLLCILTMKADLRDRTALTAPACTLLLSIAPADFSAQDGVLVAYVRSPAKLEGRLITDQAVRMALLVAPVMKTTRPPELPEERRGARLLMWITICALAVAIWRGILWGLS